MDTLVEQQSAVMSKLSMLACRSDRLKYFSSFFGIYDFKNKQLYIISAVQTQTQGHKAQRVFIIGAV